MAKHTAPVDDWEVLETAANRAREGLFISISACGRVAFSRDLVKLLDPKLPRCTLRYSISRQVLRIDFMREIALNSHQWKHGTAETGYFSQQSAFRSKGLLPENLTLYEAQHCTNEQPPHVEVDISKPLLVLEPRRRKTTGERKEVEDPAFSNCAECGARAPVRKVGGQFILTGHETPSGDKCFCRRIAKEQADG